MNEKFLTLVGLCEPPPDVTTFELCLNTAVGLYVLTTLCLDFISSSFFVIQYKKREMEDILGSILQVAAVASEIIGMISLFAFRKQMKDTFSLFQTIYNECNYRYSFVILFFGLFLDLIYRYKFTLHKAPTIRRSGYSKR